MLSLSGSYHVAITGARVASYHYHPPIGVVGNTDGIRHPRNIGVHVAHHRDYRDGKENAT